MTYTKVFENSELSYIKLTFPDYYVVMPIDEENRDYRRYQKWAAATQEERDAAGVVFADDVTL